MAELGFGFRRFGFGFFLCWRGFRRDQFAGASFGFDFGFGGGTEGMGADSEFTGKFAVTKNFDPVGPAICKPGIAEDLFVHARAFVKAIQSFEVDGQITRGVAGVVEAALGNAANERHLPAFETNTDRTAGTRALALSTAAGSLTVTARFTLAQALAAMLRAGIRL